MLSELIVAFILVLAASFLIYLFGRWSSPKPAKSADEQSTYACGEKASFPKMRINVSLYKYLICFVVLDSSVLLVAFASLTFSAENMLFFIFYLLIILASSLLLLGGGDQ